jgi:MFS family permease
MISLIRSEWKFLLFGFLMTFFSSPGQTFFVSLFSGNIRADLGLSDGQFGGLYSLATLMSAIVMVWSGSLMDRVSLERFSISVVCGLALGCVMISFSNGVVLLVVGIFLLRQMGQGLMCLASSTAMVRYLDRNKGKSNALAGMGYAVSEAVMPSIIVALIVWFGWRQSWLIVAVALIAFMIPSILVLLRGHDNRHQQYLKDIDNAESASDYIGQSGQAGQLGQRNSKIRHWDRKQVLRDKCFYLFLPGLMSQQLMFTGFIFHQIHLVESKGWSLTAWASMFAVYAVVSVVTKLVIGILVDIYGAIKMVPLVGLPMGAGLAILGMATSLSGGGVFLVLTGITVGFQSTVSAPFWAEMYGARHLGSIKSLGTSIMVLFTALSPVILGLLIDADVPIETLAIGGSVYIVLTSALAYYAYKLVQQRL